MTIFGIDPLGTTTLASSSYATDGIAESDNPAATTTLSFSLSISTACAQNHIMYDYTHSYVKSLPDEQLAYYVNN